MPGKTNTETIRELEQLGEILKVHVEYLRKDLDRIGQDSIKFAEFLSKIDTRLTVLERQYLDLNKSLEEASRRHWQIWVALIGAGLSLAGNIVLWLVRK